MRLNLLTLVFLTIASISFGQLQEVSTLKEYDKSKPLSDIEFYDINDDGLEEVIAISSDHFIVYSNLGDFDFQPDTIFSFDVNAALDLQMLNVNNSGHPEFIVSIEGGDPQVFIVEGNSISHDGDLTINSPGVLSGRITSGFINGDEFPDFIISNGSQFTVYINSGNGVYSGSQSLAVNSTSEALGDVTGDGLDDLCLANFEELLLYKNENGVYDQGDFLFEGSGYNSGASWGYEFGGNNTDFPALRMQDVNRDGRLDILYGTRNYIGKVLYEENQSTENGDVKLNAILVQSPSIFPETGSSQNAIILDKGYSIDSRNEYKLNTFPEGGSYDIGQLNGSIALEFVWSFEGSLLFKSGQTEIEIDNIGTLLGQPFIRDLDNSGEGDVLLLSKNGTTGIFKNINSWSSTNNPLEHFTPITEEAFRPVLASSASSENENLEDILVLEQSDLSNRLLAINVSQNPFYAEEVVLTWQRREEKILDLFYEDTNGDGEKDLIVLNQNIFGAGFKSFSVGVGYGSEGELSEPISITGIRQTNNDLAPELSVGNLNGDEFPDLAIGFCTSEFLFAIDCNAAVFFGSSGNGFELALTQEIGPLVAADIIEMEIGEPSDFVLNTFPGNTRSYSLGSPQSTSWNLPFIYSEIVANEFNSDGLTDLYTINRLELESELRISIADGNDDFLDPVVFEGLDKYVQLSNIAGSSALDLIGVESYTTNIGASSEQTFTWNGPSGEIINFIQGNFSDPDFGDMLSIEENNDDYQINYWRNINSNPSVIEISVFEDVNGDGVRDDGETGIAGIPVEFFNTIQDQAGLAFTNNSGEISFEVISADSLNLIVSYNQNIWELTTDNSPISISAITPPELIEFGLHSADGLVGGAESEVESDFPQRSYSQSKDASSLSFVELNGITSNSFIFIEDDYAYSWTYENNTGGSIDNINFENTIPESLDWQTFSPTGSTHNANTVITSTQGLVTLEVNYDDLILEDSAINPEESLLTYNYQIKAEAELPHGQIVNNLVSASVDGQNDVLSNETANKVYTCARFEEFTEFRVFDFCSPGGYGFTTVTNEPQATYSVWEDGILQAAENIETIYLDGDTTALGIIKNSGLYSTELDATNEFGCVFNQSIEVEIDSVPQIEIVSEADLDLCIPLFTTITAESDIAATLAWNTPVGVMQNESIQIGLPGNYSAFATDIHPTCVEMEFLEVNLLPEDVGEVGFNASSESLFFDEDFCEIQWFLNGEEIDGAISETYTPTIEGLYSCRVSSCDCFYFSEPFFWSPLGSVNDLDKQVSLFPSPAKSKINLSFGKVENVSRIAITDMLGKEYPARVNGSFSDRIEIDLNSFSQGIYLISISLETGETFSKKFVIER